MPGLAGSLVFSLTTAHLLGCEPVKVVSVKGRIRLHGHEERPPKALGSPIPSCGPSRSWAPFFLSQVWHPPRAPTSEFSREVQRRAARAGIVGELVGIEPPLSSAVLPRRGRSGRPTFASASSRPRPRAGFLRAGHRRRRRDRPRRPRHREGLGDRHHRRGRDQHDAGLPHDANRST